MKVTNYLHLVPDTPPVITCTGTLPTIRAYDFKSDIQLFRLNISHIPRLSSAQCSSFLHILPS
jgi:hypothetical protein